MINDPEYKMYLILAKMEELRDKWEQRGLQGEEAEIDDMVLNFLAGATVGLNIAIEEARTIIRR